MAEREALSIPGAPPPIAPFSPAIKAAGLVFVSGQLPLNTAGTMPEGIAAQTRQCLENIKALVEAAGSSMDRVLKCTVFLTNFDDFSKMNEVYGQYFQGAPPARAAVEVSRLARGALVEIEAVALA
ncbi:MAG TPA: deaminase [Dehalococcoidia bacterium]|nr:deaminase [Dehalococcoidia bacterium]